MFSKRSVLYLQSYNILYHFSNIFLLLNAVFTVIKIFNMSSPQDQSPELQCLLKVKQDLS